MAIFVDCITRKMKIVVMYLQVLCIFEIIIGAMKLLALGMMMDICAVDIGENTLVHMEYMHHVQLMIVRQ